MVADTNPQTKLPKTEKQRPRKHPVGNDTQKERKTKHRTLNLPREPNESFRHQTIHRKLLQGPRHRAKERITETQTPNYTKEAIVEPQTPSYTKEPIAMP